MVHDFTALPFKITVHAPQLLVSHPTCAPVSPIASRIKWISSSLGSAAASRCLPLILIVISSFFAMPISSGRTAEPLFTCALQRAGKRTLGKFLDYTFFVLRRPAQIRAGLRRIGGKLRRLRDGRCIQLLAANQLFRL